MLLSSVDKGFISLQGDRVGCDSVSAATSESGDDFRGDSGTCRLYLRQRRRRDEEEDASRDASDADELHTESSDAAFHSWGSSEDGDAPNDNAGAGCGQVGGPDSDDDAAVGHGHPVPGGGGGGGPGDDDPDDGDDGDGHHGGGPGPAGGGGPGDNDPDGGEDAGLHGEDPEGGGDPDDPDDPALGDDEDSMDSESDPDEDMADADATFSWQNPALDRALVMNNQDLTSRELLCMIIALSVRSRLDYETITKLLAIFNLSFGQRQLPQTKKTLWASLGRNWIGLKKHAYCSACTHYFGIRGNLPRVVVCEHCQHTSRRGDVHYFMTFNVRNQLKTLLDEPGQWHNLQYPQRRVMVNADAVEDILDGDGYHRIPKGPFDFTYQFNLDPFSTSKSSKTEVCPIFMKINEFPPNLRQKNVILAGLWLGPKNLDYNLFMTVFRKQCNKILERGVTWRPDPLGQEQVSRFFPTCGVCDAVGRAGVMNLHTHAGAYSCPYCEHPGVFLDGAMKFPVPGTVVERVRVMNGVEILEEVNIPDDIGLRTDESIRADMALQDPHRTGFKGPAEVALLNQFDLSAGFSTDDLHPIYLGVTKFHTELLLAGIPGVFNVTRAQKKLITRRMKAIKTPTHLSRKPRGIDQMAKWKGSEWRNWLLYYAVPCLQGIVPDHYLRHFGCLSEAVFLLSRDSVTAENFDEADQLLRRYHEDFQEIFGPECMRYNIHILTHLVRWVRLWGPLWATSTMPFESWNFRLRKCVSSPKGALEQISMRYLMVQLVRAIPFQEDISADVKELVKFIQEGTPPQYEEVEGALFFGKSTIRAPTPDELLLLQEQHLNCDNVTVYPQVRRNSFECRSAAYRDDIQSVNSLVYTLDDTFHQVNNIVVFQSGEDLVGGMFTTVIEVDPQEPLDNVPHIVPIINENESAFIRVESIRNLAMKMSVDDLWYIAPMANQVEID